MFVSKLTLSVPLQSIPSTDPSALPPWSPREKENKCKANGWTSSQKAQVQIMFCHRLPMWLQTSQSPRALAGINTVSLQPLIYSTEMETKLVSKAFLLPCVMMTERYEEDMISLNTSGSFLSQFFSVFPPYPALNSGHSLQVSDSPVSGNARCCTKK